MTYSWTSDLDVAESLAQLKYAMGTAEYPGMAYTVAHSDGLGDPTAYGHVERAFRAVLLVVCKGDETLATITEDIWADSGYESVGRALEHARLKRADIAREEFARSLPESAHGVLNHAAELHSDERDGGNLEYDRALYQLACNVIGVSGDEQRAWVRALIREYAGQPV